MPLNYLVVLPLKEFRFRMCKTFYFSHKAMRILRIIFAVLLPILFIVAMIFEFNVVALVIGIIFSVLLDLILLFLNRRKIILDYKNHALILVEFVTEEIKVEDIVDIYCDERKGLYICGRIVIKTIKDEVTTVGHTFGRSVNESANKAVVKELRKWVNNTKKKLNQPSLPNNSNDSIF